MVGVGPPPATHGDGVEGWGVESYNMTLGREGKDRNGLRKMIGSSLKINGNTLLPKYDPAKHTTCPRANPVK